MRRRRVGAAFGAAMVMMGMAACAGSGESDGRVQIEFFQFKGEAVGTFDALIAQFEVEHPGIDIVQNNVPSPDAALRTRLVKNDVPTVMTLNGNGGTYGDLAMAGIFRDFTGDPALEVTTQASQDVLNALGSMPGETNGIPFANNANSVIYNVDIFTELGLEVPTTWDELLATAQAVRDGGYVPFYHTWREAWTTLPPFNTLAQNIPDDDFWDRRIAGETTFAVTFDGDWRCSVDARWRPIWLMRAELRGPTLRKPIGLRDVNQPDPNSHPPAVKAARERPARGQLVWRRRTKHAARGPLARGLGVEG